MIRPQPATWFEVLLASEDTALALEALAMTGAVELEPRYAARTGTTLSELKQPLQRFAELSRQYGAYWPLPEAFSAPEPSPPLLTLVSSLQRIQAWANEADSVLQRLQRIEAEHAELLRWNTLFTQLRECSLEFALLAGAGPVLQANLVAFPEHFALPDSTSLLARRFEVDGVEHALIIAPSARMQTLCQQVIAAKGQVVVLPRWLRSTVAENQAHIARHEAVLAKESAELRVQLETLHRRYALCDALGKIRRLEWFVENARGLEAGEIFAWITGWTSDAGGNHLIEALRRCSARALLHFPLPPVGASPPILLQNPWWAKPFEIFSKALGTPGRDEADPSQVLALVMPLLFGYMFGDVGQGLVLVAAGWLLQGRWPLARLLIAGGWSAMVFGLLFGNVFTREDWLPALWLHPLDSPLLVLGIPLIAGALLISLGMILTGLEAYWRGNLGSWLLSDAGLVAVYLGIVSGLLFAQGYLLAVAGLLGHVGSQVWLERRAPAAITAMAGLLENTLRVLVNTLSFARVGAFALAHAGLSAAVVTLAEAAGNPAGQFLLLFVGNALMLTLEVMVVSIQTTRLVLFEFFTRFLRGGGRRFHPLPLPPVASPG